MLRSSFVFVSSSILSFTIVWSFDLLDFWVWLIVAGGRFGVLETGRGSVFSEGARAAAVAIMDSLRSRRIVAGAVGAVLRASDTQSSRCALVPDTDHQAALGYAATLEPRLMSIYAVVVHPGGAYSTHACKINMLCAGFSGPPRRR